MLESSLEITISRTSLHQLSEWFDYLRLSLINDLSMFCSEY